MCGVLHVSTWVSVMKTSARWMKTTAVRTITMVTRKQMESVSPVGLPCGLPGLRGHRVTFCVGKE